MGQQLYVDLNTMNENGWERSIEELESGYWWEDEDGREHYIQPVRVVVWTHPIHGKLTGTYDIPCEGFYMDINRGGANWEIAVEYGLLAIGEIV